MNRRRVMMTLSPREIAAWDYVARVWGTTRSGVVGLVGTRLEELILKGREDALQDLRQHVLLEDVLADDAPVD